MNKFIAMNRFKIAIGRESDFEDNIESINSQEELINHIPYVYNQFKKTVRINIIEEQKDIESNYKKAKMERKMATLRLDRFNVNNNEESSLQSNSDILSVSSM